MMLYRPLRAARHSLSSAVLWATLGCQGVSASGAAATICQEAGRSLLPAEAVSVRNRGDMADGAYRVTRLPRAGGRAAMVMTDIRSHMKRGGVVEETNRDFAYFEDERTCWQGYQNSSTLFCYESSLESDPYSNFIESDDTRAVLSVATFFVTGGRADAAARRIARRETAAVPFERLLEQTSAPDEVGPWYFCQTCGGPPTQLPNTVSLAGVRLGRSRNATFFITRSGWVARLADGSHRAAYVQCNSQKRKG
jgi:hypothetical protein